MKEINLGDTVKDTVTGFKGMAVARTEWLYGCARITVQPKGTTKDGELKDPSSFDEPQLVLVSRAAKKVTSTNTGGPMPSPETKRIITKN